MRRRAKVRLVAEETASEGGGARIIARAKLPTRHGDFTIVGFEHGPGGGEHVAIIKGEVEGAERVLCRVHSECVTGDVFGSRRCDCGEQLEVALDQIEREGAGIVLYMRQEGRGIGLTNKVRAYELQDAGLDTVEANHHLGFDDDLRDYSLAAQMLHGLGPRSIVLMTNNPNKYEALQSAGVPIDERVPLRIAPNPENASYLKTKRLKSGHDL